MLKKILLACVLSIGVANAETTTHDYYRLGNATTPRMDHVRAGDDAIVETRGKVEWVKAGTKLGMSGKVKPQDVKNEWKLPKGSAVPEGLNFVNDGTNHSQFEPEKDMTLENYKKLLLSIKTFTKLK